jgi:3-oxoacyl-[acyl-carrier protein] reductase
MATSDPEHARTASTNLGGVAGYRPLEGKLGIITGASRGIHILFFVSCFQIPADNSPGIGTAIAHNLASKGVSLVLNYTSDSSSAACTALSQTLTELHGVTCLCVQADGSLFTFSSP